MKVAQAALCAGMLFPWLMGCEKANNPISGPVGQAPVASSPATQLSPTDPDEFAGLVKNQLEQLERENTLPGAAGSEGPHRRMRDPYAMVGRKLTEWDLGEWQNSLPMDMSELDGRVVVVRWWTDESEDCERTMPALQKLADEFAGQPVQFVGIYHSKGSFVDKDWRIAIAKSKELGLTMPVAYDRDWRTLNDWWRRRLHHMPTTPTFVISPEGRILHLHPGPVFYPTENPLESLCNEDYLALRDAIRKALPNNLADTQREGEGA